MVDRCGTQSDLVRSEVKTSCIDSSLIVAWSAIVEERIHSVIQLHGNGSTDDWSNWNRVVEVDCEVRHGVDDYLHNC